MTELKVKSLFNLEETIATELLESVEYPFEVLPRIHDFICTLGIQLPKEEFVEVKEQLWVHRTAKVSETASLQGPLIIDQNAEIRHCAFLRGDCIVGANAVVGNSTELKNSILFNHVEVPHYNYVGDSILGYYAHMGAGAVTSNLKSDRSLVTITKENEKIQTNLRKMGAILGDHVEIGCHTVLNPGTVVGSNTIIYPSSMVRGYIAANSIYKSATEIVKKQSYSTMVE